MGKALVVGDVVDADQLDVVGALREYGPVEVAADAAEAVDAYADGHGTRDSFADRRRAPAGPGAGAVAHVVVDTEIRPYGICRCPCDVPAPLWMRAPARAHSPC
jgi:hypothetical protein